MPGPTTTILNEDIKELKDDILVMRQEMREDFKEVHAQMLALSNRTREENLAFANRMHDEIVALGNRTHDEIVALGVRMHEENVARSDRMHDEIVALGNRMHDEMKSLAKGTGDQIQALGIQFAESKTRTDTSISYINWFGGLLVTVSIGAVIAGVFRAGQITNGIEELGKRFDRYEAAKPVPIPSPAGQSAPLSKP